MLDWNAHITFNFQWWEAAKTNQREHIERNKYVLASDNDLRRNVVWFAQNVLQPVRTKLQRQMHVDSWFRYDALNVAVGGQPNSRHKLGLACDFLVPGSPISQVFASVKAILLGEGIEFDELLHEGDELGGWCHLSALPEGAHNRRYIGRVVHP